MIELESRHIKHYPHFDAPLTLEAAHTLVNSPELVAKHSFFPFIVDQKKHQPYRTPRNSSGKSKGRPKPKVRPIRSTARRDAAIYAAYRQILSGYYEKDIADNKLGSCITGYRSIPIAPGEGGKANYHHAYDVFTKVQEMDRCVVITLDISNFFENIDHALLKASWRKLIGQDSLPSDHQAVFKNITNYSWVDRHQLYRSLGFVTNTVIRGVPVEVPMRRDLPIVLCAGEELRALHKKSKSEGDELINKNLSGRGIPQGSPISDLLANIYLVEFDKVINSLAIDYGGIYKRYSDDIVLVIPGGLKLATSIRAMVRKEIRKHRRYLEIKQRKTHTVMFEKIGQTTQLTSSKRNVRKLRGIEYLGFRFDGDKVKFRDSTISRLRSKASKIVKKEAKATVKRYPGKSLDFLQGKFNDAQVVQIIGRCSVKRHDSSPKRQSFHTYAHMCQSVFGPTLGSELFKVLKYRLWVQKDKETYLKRYYKTG